MAEAVELCTLPVELQHHIVLNLDPSAAIALKQTNRWFHTHISLHRLDKTKVQQYLHRLELHPRNEHFYACFSCLCLKPQTAFTTVQIGTKISSRNGSYSSQRYCLECGIRNGKYKPGTSLKMAGPESEPKVLCGACMSVQAYFCRSCLCCSGCIASMRTWTGRAARWSRGGGQGFCGRHFRR